MLKGKSISELASELERQSKTKRDFLLDTQSIEIEAESRVGGLPVAKIDGVGTFGINDTFHLQASNKLGIPKKYYDRMLVEAPQLLAENVNHWLHERSSKSLVRTLDGSLRALLSDRYRPLDNLDLAEAVLPTLLEKQCNVISSEITPRRMYIQSVLPKMTTEIKAGDVVQAGVIVSNSEIGMGALRVEPMVYRFVCLNGLISSQSLSKYHIGRTGDNSEEAVYEMFSESTKSLTDKAFWNQVRDVVRASFDEVHFKLIADKFREASDERISGDPVKVVEVTASHFGLSDKERGTVLRNLIEDRDLSKWGLLNAVTKTAHNSEDYDRCVELERIGGQVLELPKTSWQEISSAE